MAILVRDGATPFTFDRVDRLDHDQRADVSRLLRAVIRADEHRGVGANVLEVLAAPGGGVGILAGEEQRLDGLAFCRPTGDGHTWDVELTVHPARRGNGLGGSLLDLALESVPAGMATRVWAYRPGEPQRRLAAHRGLVPAQHLLQLRGGTALDVTARPPDGVRLRTYAQGGDAPAVVAVQNAAFTTELVTEREVLTRLARPNMGPDHLVIAEVADGAIAGFCWMADPRPDGEGAGHGELVLLAVHPDHHGGGLGTALTVAGMDLLDRRGVERCMIYTDAANEHAVRLYRKLGFRTHHTDVALTADGTLPWPEQRPAL